MAYVVVTFTRVVWCPYCGWDLEAPPPWEHVAKCPTCHQEFALNGEHSVIRHGHAARLQRFPDQGLY